MDEPNIVPIGRKRGRPRNHMLDWYRHNFEWSARTNARYHRAINIINALNEDGASIDHNDVIKQGIRPNGSVNVSRFVHAAEQLFIQHIESKPKEENH